MRHSQTDSHPTVTLGTFVPPLTWILLLVTACFVAFVAAAADSADDQYISIYKAIEQADALKAKGQTNAAKAKYEEAQTALLNLKKSEPLWNPKMVALRLDSLKEKIASVSPHLATLPAAPAAAPQPEAKPEKKAAPVPAKSAIKLLEPGSEPRKALRIHPKRDDKQTIETTVKMAMSMGDAMQGVMKMPAIKMTIGAAAKNVSAEGDISLEEVIEDVAVTDEPGSKSGTAEAMNTALQAIKGVTTTITMSDRGLTKKVEAKMVPGMPPQAQSVMEQIKDSAWDTQIALPDEAVGVGAKWEHKSKKKTQGMAIDQTTTHEIIAIQGEVVQIKSSIVQHATNQKIANPAMPQVKTELVELNGSGELNWKVDLGKVLPLEAKGESHVESTVAVNAGGQKQTMSVKNDAFVQIQSK